MLIIEQVKARARKGGLLLIIGSAMAVAAPVWAQTDANHAPKVMTQVSLPSPADQVEIPANTGDTPLVNDDSQQQKARPGQTPRPAGGREASQEGLRYGDSGFVGEIINLNVVDADIRDVLQLITHQYGVNFVIDSSIKPGDVKISVNVNNVPWNVALDAILRANGLGVDVNGPILRIAKNTVLAEEAALRSKANDNALRSKPLFTEIIRLNYARPTSDLNKAGESITVYTGAVVQGSAGNTGAGGGGGAGILPIIQRRLSPLGSIEFDGRSNTLIVTDIKESLEAVRQLVALLDRPEPQVEIEARIVIANRNFSRDLGAQLNALAINGQTGGTAGLGTARGTPLVGGGGASNTIGLRPPGIPQGIQDPSGALGANLPNTVIGLTTGVIGTAQITLLLTAAESKGQAKVVASPRVTALNNRPAQIESGQQIPVVTPQTGAGGSGGALIFTTTFVSAPLRLAVTPQITDAGTVILRIVAENNTINTAVAINGTPGIDSQRMQSEVLVPDGGTTVVGGVLADSETELQNRTPGVSSIPLFGNLFKRKAVSRQTNEILFFITPRIYRPDYQGNPMTGVTNATGTRSTVISQPVPLGNPRSNTAGPNGEPQTTEGEKQQEPKKPQN
jgi:type IV pilus assembly protein PilQ